MSEEGSNGMTSAQGTGVERQRGECCSCGLPRAICQKPTLGALGLDPAAVERNVVEAVAVAMVSELERRWLLARLEAMFGTVRVGGSLAVVVAELRDLADRLDPTGACVPCGEREAA
jgi:hypothetical protein